MYNLQGFKDSIRAILILICSNSLTSKNRKPNHLLTKKTVFMTNPQYILARFWYHDMVTYHVDPDGINQPTFLNDTVNVKQKKTEGLDISPN